MSQSGTHSEVVDSDVGQSFYAQQQKIYPRQVHGLFATFRVTAVLVLLGLFYGVVWLHWDGQQLVLFDLPARKFHVFGITFFPQDFLYLAFMLIIAALALFFFTALAGRLWCGYACPQTVWTEAFLWIERKVEGNRSQQMKLDRGPLNARKMWLKSVKHGIWVVFSLWTGFTFVGYFTPIVDLGTRLLAIQLGPWETFWVLFYGFATYGNAGWMREQVCIYMCPYARFQSAMFDPDTLIISYDEARGDPRGSRQRGTDPSNSGLGDCIDCTMCVQVCPTGIDIRDGLQYQCIGCAACVDVCDQVMEKMAYPKGLIRYTTENALAGKPSRILRPRVIIYSVALLALVVGLAASVLGRNPLEVDITRDRNALYRELGNGRIENIYTVRMVNKDSVPHSLMLAVYGEVPMILVIDDPRVVMPAGSMSSSVMRVQAFVHDLPARSTSLDFIVRSLDTGEILVEEEARFLGPVATP